jgi:hypothetical protein
MPDGRYTSMLNEYGAEGWELVTVAHDVASVPQQQREGGLPMPPRLGKLGQAASKRSELEGRDASEPEPGSVSTTLLWVLRRPLDDD